MMETKRPTKKTSESRVVKTQKVFPDDLNNNYTLFGGCILSLIDAYGIHFRGKTYKKVFSDSIHRFCKLYQSC